MWPQLTFPLTLDKPLVLASMHIFDDTTFVPKDGTPHPLPVSVDGGGLAGPLPSHALLGRLSHRRLASSSSLAVVPFLLIPACVSVHHVSFP